MDGITICAEFTNLFNLLFAQVPTVELMNMAGDAPRVPPCYNL
jgi:hypothetical protein